MGNFKEALMLAKKTKLSNELSISELNIIADNYISLSSQIEARIANDQRFEAPIIDTSIIEREVILEFLNKEKEQRKNR